MLTWHKKAAPKVFTYRQIESSLNLVCSAAAVLYKTGCVNLACYTNKVTTQFQILLLIGKNTEKPGWARSFDTSALLQGFICLVDVCLSTRTSHWFLIASFSALSLLLPIHSSARVAAGDEWLRSRDQLGAALELHRCRQTQALHTLATQRATAHLTGDTHTAMCSRTFKNDSRSKSAVWFFQGWCDRKCSLSN